MANLKGALGWKGERGYSAYETAVQNGFVGTEKDWLAQLGTSSHFDRKSAIYEATLGQTEFSLPDDYTSNSFIDIYVEGEHLDSSEYTLDASAMKITLSNAITVTSTKVEIVSITMSTNNLPIVDVINESSTNDTVPSTKAVYEFVKNMIEGMGGNN